MMKTDNRSSIPFVRQYGDPSIASQMAADHRRQKLGRTLAYLEGYFEKDSLAQVRSAKVTTADWLGQWARMGGLSEELVAESYIDYWFLFTVVDTLGAESCRAGISMVDFIKHMNQPLVALKKISPDKTPPLLRLSPGPGESMLLEIETPRHLADGMIPGFVRRIADCFMTRCTVAVFYGRPLPCWQLDFLNPLGKIHPLDVPEIK